jgi:hypothetical protein
MNSSPAFSMLASGGKNKNARQDIDSHFRHRVCCSPRPVVTTKVPVRALIHEWWAIVVRHSLHVSRSSDVVWIAIAGARVSFRCLMTLLAYPIANPAFIVCDARSKPFHFVPVFAV